MGAAASLERDERTYPVTIWYRMQFESEHVPEDLRLLIDGMKAESRSFFINGEELKAEPRGASLTPR